MEGKTQGRVELAPLPAHAARPRILSQRIDHRAAHAPLRKGFKLDPAILVEAVRRIDQAEHAVLHEVADIDGVRHRGGHTPRERFDEGQAGDDATVLADGSGLDAHSDVSSPGFVTRDSGFEYRSRLPASAHHRNGGTNGRGYLTDENNSCRLLIANC